MMENLLKANMKTSQKNLILRMLKEYGWVDNVWCFNHNILRLGAIIERLRKEGYKIRTEYKNQSGKRNTHYYLETKPTITKYIIDGGRTIEVKNYNIK